MQIKNFNLKEIDAEKEIYIYGTTIGGWLVYQALKRQGVHIAGFLNQSLDERKYFAISVCTPHQINKTGSVIIIALLRSFESACHTLSKAGFSVAYQCVDLIAGLKIDDFEIPSSKLIEAKSFLTNYSRYALCVENENVILPVLEVFVTECCTLKCRDCSHLITYYKHPQHYDVSDLTMWLSSLLKAVERINELIILGGEPFLYPHLLKLLEWAYGNKKIGRIYILSNGTIIPPKDVLQRLKAMEVCIRFSDYGLLSTKLRKFIEICKDMDISYYSYNDKWTDMGKIENHHYTDENLREVFHSCPFAYDYLLLDGMLFPCAHVAHMNHLGYIHTNLHDSVDVREFNSQGITKSSEKIRNLMTLDYLEGCQYCNGVGNRAPDLEPAIQL